MIDLTNKGDEDEGKEKPKNTPGKYIIASAPTQTEHEAIITEALKESLGRAFRYIIENVNDSGPEETSVAARTLHVHTTKVQKRRVNRNAFEGKEGLRDKVEAVFDSLMNEEELGIPYEIGSYVRFDFDSNQKRGVIILEKAKYLRAYQIVVDAVTTTYQDKVTEYRAWRVGEEPEVTEERTEEKLVLRVPSGIAGRDSDVSDQELIQAMKHRYLCHHQINDEDWELVRMYRALESHAPTSSSFRPGRRCSRSSPGPGSNTP